MQIAVRVRFLIQLQGIALLQHLPDDPLILGLGTVAPHDALRLGQPSRLLNPFFQWGRHKAPSEKPRQPPRASPGVADEFSSLQYFGEVGKTSRKAYPDLARLPSVRDFAGRAAIPVGTRPRP